jgi:Cu(I)/Ag(I) efflux system membrane fusion protein
VREGLQEGELVVTQGNFKIDSAIQILARPSMMNPESETDSFEVADAFRSELEAVLSVYFELQQALSQDSLEQAQTLAGSLDQALSLVTADPGSREALQAWEVDRGSLVGATKGLRRSDSLEAARSRFRQISDRLTNATRKYQLGGDQPILRFHCSMAFDGEGAYWLQNREGTENPYYGSMMFRCGEQVEVISAPAGSEAQDHSHG